MTHSRDRSTILFRHSHFTTRRRALTLVEILIGMAITLLMMAAVVNLFAVIGSGVRIRQATIEMSAELRTVRSTLYNDLTHATCRTLPWQRPDEDQGYFEIVERQFTDISPSALINDDPGDGNVGELNYQISQVPSSEVVLNENSTFAQNGFITDGTGLGDFDDIMAFTVRRDSSPFKGQAIVYDPNNRPVIEVVESSVAEVIWFATENDLNSVIEEPGMRKVYRRELLVAPWVDLSYLNSDPSFAPDVTDNVTIANSYQRFHLVCDLSVRIEETSPGVFRWIANTLGDLTKRENRYAHYCNFNTSDSWVSGFPPARGFPHRFPYDVTNPDPNDDVLAGVPNSSLQPLAGDRLGDDLILENVLAFDVLVYDPGAPLFQYEGTLIEPSGGDVFDPSAAVNPNNLVGFGAYVDIGWDRNYDYNPSDPNRNNYNPDYKNAYPDLPAAQFQEEYRPGWHPARPNAPFGLFTPTYDTWSFHYEHDGIDQDLDGLIDEGTNGLDDDNANGVDDLLERETSPPYDVPLRGVRVKLRIYEPNTRQAREVSVTASFVPQ